MGVLKSRGKLILLALAVILLAMLLPGAALAQDEPQVLSSSAKVDFPLRMQFTLQARSGTNITDVRLSYRVERESFASVVSEALVPFTPGPAVNVTWSLDMRRVGGFPPGTVVWYWWNIADARGRTTTTQPAKLLFDDTRYQWRQLTEGKITLYWYNGDDAFARELMKAAQDAIVRLEMNTGAVPQKQTPLYIYATSQDLLGAMIHPQEWTGGVTYPTYNVLAIGISPSNLAWGKRAITHELSHLIVHQMTINPYNDLPNWLDEGLAMYNEGPLDVSYQVLLTTAISRNALLSVRNISSPFSANANLAVLSYAESFSLVDYLIGQYGQARMLEMLMSFKAGATYDGALQKVYGFDRDGLNSRWQDWATAKYVPQKTASRLDFLFPVFPLTHTVIPSVARNPSLLSPVNGFLTFTPFGFGMTISHFPTTSTRGATP